MTPNDFFGYFAVATNVLGNFLLARKSIHGWIIRIVSILLWGVYAVGAASGPQLVNSILFFFINLYGLYFWKKKAGHADSCRLKPCNCGRLA